MSAIQLNLIAFDAGTQVRAAINEDVVAEYAGRMSTGETFPPIVLFHDGSAYYLADGFHRVMAARRNEWMSISADVHAGTKTDALWFALGANKANGQRMTTADKKHAIELALKTWPDRSQNQIAEQIGCSQQHVQQIKVQVTSTCNLPATVTGKDGKTYPASKTAAAAIRSQEFTKVAEAIQAGESSKAICERLDVRGDFVGQVRREIGAATSDNSRAGVAQRKKDIADMAKRGFATRQIAEAIGIHPSTVAEIAKREGIVIHADRVIRGTRHIDANRVVEQTVMDAENLTSAIDLIAFDDLDRDKLSAWVDSLKQSQRALGDFVKRLLKEQHGQAA